MTFTKILKTKNFDKIKMEDFEKIQELEEKYNIHILTWDNLDYELNIWAEYMMQDRGYNFRDLYDMVYGEPYFDKMLSTYEYYLLEQGCDAPCVEASFETIEELEDYIKETKKY